MASLLFGELLTRLGDEGFAIGLDDHLRVGELAYHLGPDDDLASLGDLLCPLFARSEEERRRFRKIFAAYVAGQPPVRQDEGDSSAVDVAYAGAEDVALRPAAKPKNLVRIVLRILVAAMFAGFLTCFGVGGYILFYVLPHAFQRIPQPVTQGQQVQTSTNVTTETVAHREQRESTKPVRAPNQWQRAPADVPILIAIASVLAVFGMDAAVAAVRRRRRRTRAGWRLPFHTPMERSSIDDLFQTPEITHAARLLAGQVAGGRLRFDARRTVDATARAGGLPVIVERAPASRREHLAVIERLSPNDHLAAYFERLTAMLSTSGVAIERYFFDSDPRSCLDPRSGARLALSELQHRQAATSLIIMGSLDALLDPETGIPALPDDAGSWSTVAALLPEWTGEIQHARNDDVGAARGDAEGLLLVAEAIAEGRQIVHSRSDRDPIIGSNPTIAELRRTLPVPAFMWLCACALHDELRWDLTIALGRLTAPSFDARLLLKIIRLPWFRTGAIPAARRAELVGALADERLGELHVAIAELLAATPRPSGSYAAALLGIEELTHRAEAAGQDADRLRTVFRHVRQYPTSLVRRQPAILAMMKRPAVIGRSAWLPHWSRKVLFRGGSPPLGLRSFALTMIAFLIAAAITAAVVYLRPPVPRIVDVKTMRTVTWVETVTLPATPSPTATAQSGVDGGSSGIGEMIGNVIAQYWAVYQMQNQLQETLSAQSPRTSFQYDGPRNIFQTWVHVEWVRQSDGTWIETRRNAGNLSMSREKSPETYIWREIGRQTIFGSSGIIVRKDNTREEVFVPDLYGRGLSSPTILTRSDSGQWETLTELPGTEIAP